MLMFFLTAAIIGSVYWLWVRPILKLRPEFRELYEREESLFAALREKLKGIKQKLSSVVVIAVSVAVSGYDFIEPILSGVDVSPLSARVPSWAWPLIVIALTALFQFLRNLADRRNAEESAQAASNGPAHTGGG